MIGYFESSKTFVTQRHTMERSHHGVWHAGDVTSPFVSCVNDLDLLEKNLRRSPDVASLGLRTYENVKSAASAYNDALDNAPLGSEYTIFLHQDIYLPEHWMEKLRSEIAYLTSLDPTWAVLGCYGVTEAGRGVGHVFSNGMGVIGGPFELPIKARTLDEIVLVVRHAPLLRFTEGHPGFHLYGTDICIRSEQLGMNCYVIDDFCVHNALHSTVLPLAFYEGYVAIARNFPAALPVMAPCHLVTGSTLPICITLLRQRIAKIFKGWRTVERMANPTEVICSRSPLQAGEH